MAGEKDDLVLDDPKPNQETPDEGLEAEADAEHPDREDDADGAEGEGAAEGDGPDAAEGEIERKPSRGELRFQKLSQTAREANERAARLETESQDLKGRLARLEQPQQSRGKSAEEMALMTPDELIDYRLGEATKGFEQKLGAIQWATYESGDKASFQALVARNATAARFAVEVETRLTAMRAAGQNVDRERLLKYIIGEQVFEKSTGAKEKQKVDGQRRIQRQASGTTASKGDTQSNRGRMSEAEAREKRLENQTF